MSPNEMYMYKKSGFRSWLLQVWLQQLHGPWWAAHQHSGEVGYLLDGEPITTEQLDILYVIVAEEAELDFT